MEFNHRLGAFVLSQQPLLNFEHIFQILLRNYFKTFDKLVIILTMLNEAFRKALENERFDNKILKAKIPEPVLMMFEPEGRKKWNLKNYVSGSPRVRLVGNFLIHE